jgi:YGGT family
MNYQPYSNDPRRQGYGQTTDQVPYANQGNGAANETARSSDIGGTRAESQHESYVDPVGNRVDSREEVLEDTNQSRANTRYWIASVTYFVFGVLEAILLLRFFFRLLGANRSNDFITFLYSLSHVFVSPFNGIFNDQALGNFSVFEVSTLVAMLIYALLAWGIVALGRVVFAPNLTGRQRITTTRRSRSL